MPKKIYSFDIYNPSMFSKFFLKRPARKAELNNLQLIVDIVSTLFPEQSRRTRLTAYTTFESLGMDSMMYIELFIKIEEATKFDIEVIAKKLDFHEIKTLGDLSKILQSCETPG